MALADSSKVVSLYVDGQKRIFSTDATTVAEVLSTNGVTLERDDLVEPGSATRVPAGFFNVNVFRARPVAIVDGAQTLTVRSALSSPRLIVTAAGVRTYTEDLFESETVTDFVSDRALGQRITVKRAMPVMVAVDGKKLQLRTQSRTVGELLKEKGIALGVKDAVQPGLDAGISSGLEVAVDRVADAVVTQEVLVPRTVKTVTDENLAKGERQVRTEGADGKKRVTYQIHYVNGVETSRQTLKVENLSQPVTRVVAVGTKVVTPPDDVWYKLRLCESGNTYSRNSGNGYYGAYQFDIYTWHSNGGVGYPHQAAPEVQDAIAKRLQALRGWYPWPSCAAKLGLI